MKQTPEARAEKRYPTEHVSNGFASLTDYHTDQRETFAACIREEVEPLEFKVQEQEDEVAKLRALVQGILDLSFHDTECDSIHGAKCDCMKRVIDARAKEEGFTPTTNTEDK